MMIGKVAGARALGLYSTAYTLVRYPTNLLVNAAQAVAFPASNVYREQPQLLAWGHQRAAFLISVLILPFFAAVALVASWSSSRSTGRHGSPPRPRSPCSPSRCPARADRDHRPILWGTGRVASNSARN